MHFAARNNNGALLLALIRHGAIIDARSVTGWTPAHVAAAFGSTVAISALIHYGANVNSMDNEGDTLLITVCSLRSQANTAHLLLASGADPRLASRSRETPLHVAAESESVLTSSLLLAHGAPIHATNRVSCVVEAFNARPHLFSKIPAVS